MLAVPGRSPRVRTPCRSPNDDRGPPGGTTTGVPQEERRPGSPRRNDDRGPPGGTTTGVPQEERRPGSPRRNDDRGPPGGTTTGVPQEERRPGPAGGTTTGPRRRNDDGGLLVLPSEGTPSGRLRSTSAKQAAVPQRPFRLRLGAPPG